MKTPTLTALRALARAHGLKVDWYPLPARDLVSLDLIAGNHIVMSFFGPKDKMLRAAYAAIKVGS